MKNEEILMKAIKKAVSNGWQSVLEHWGTVEKIELSMTTGMGWVWYEAGDGEQFNLYAIIFSHDFAKAFWSGNQYCEICEITVAGDYCLSHYEKYKLKPTFLYHLREMVCEENPIRYLE